MSDKDNHRPDPREDSQSSSSSRPGFTSIQAVQGELRALSSDGVIYAWNSAARLDQDGEWEISGMDTSDFRFWIPLPPPP